MAPGWFAEFKTSSAATRRGILGRIGAVVIAGMTAWGGDPVVLDAKKKRKNRNKPPTLSDWAGTWNTRLINGTQVIKGTATFKKDGSGYCCDGTYVNSVGSGVFRCYSEAPKTDLGCRWDQDDGSSGDFVIDLTDNDHWKGRYRIDNEGGGTWSGVRR